MADLLTPILDIPYANGDDPLGNVDVAMGNLAARVEQLLVQNDLLVRKTLDESVASSTVLQDDNELFVTVEANAVYEFELLAFYSSAAGNAPDFKVLMVAPAGAVAKWRYLGYTLTATSDADGAGLRYNDDDLTTGSTTFGTFTGTVPLELHGLLVVGITGGTFKLQWSQGTSNATPTIVRANSFLKLRKLI